MPDVTARAAMTPDELADWMREYGYIDQHERLAAAELASEDRGLGVHRTTIYKWLSGERQIDQRTKLALETLGRRRARSRKRKVA
jgi:hypothetical protein